MKKLYVFFAVLMVTLLVNNEAGAQGQGNRQNNGNGNWNNNRNHQDQREQERKTYYYYPSSNVYYSPVSRDYWYQKNGGWIKVDRLPRNITVFNQPKYDVYYDGRDGNVWKDNRMHYEKYRPVPYRDVAMQHAQPGVRVDIHKRF